MARISAGLLLYRVDNATLEVLLVHPGGPFWANKDAGSWSIPKGEASPGEDLLTRAKQEVLEETGLVVDGMFRPLTPVKQGGGKIVHAWALAADFDPATLKSNTFTLEWPPRSGRVQEFPEVDRAGWFTLAEARQKIIKAQAALLDQLETLLG
jgi:predicted NUDIX family NTP pyrophosphohydrolase